MCFCYSRQLFILFCERYARHWSERWLEEQTTDVIVFPSNGKNNFFLVPLESPGHGRFLRRVLLASDFSNILYCFWKQVYYNRYSWPLSWPFPSLDLCSCFLPPTLNCRSSMSLPLLLASVSPPLPFCLGLFDYHALLKIPHSLDVDFHKALYLYLPQSWHRDVPFHLLSCLLKSKIEHQKNILLWPVRSAITLIIKQDVKQQILYSPRSH